MKTVGIIAEYNPFHLGHAYQLSKAVSGEQDSVVVAVMSGDYVQRGEAALFNKYTRAEAACRCGSDLVLELPYPWCCAPAETFARGGVGILAGMGVEEISFGAETEDIGLLEETAEILDEESFRTQVSEFLIKNKNVPYAEARQIVLRSLDEKKAELLSQPNCILGLEYLKAIREYGFEIKTSAVRREGSGHDEEGGEGILSASEIRRRFREGESLRGLVPDAAEEVYGRDILAGKLQYDAQRLLLTRLMAMEKETIASAAFCGGGLGEALYKAVHSCRTLQEIEDKVSCRTYTRARVRRAICSAAVGSRVEPGRDLPEYARILCMNEKGRAYLRAVRGKTTIDVLTKPADVQNLSRNAQRTFEVTAAAHDLYTLGYKDSAAYRPGEDYLQGPVVL